MGEWVFLLGLFRFFGLGGFGFGIVWDLGRSGDFGGVCLFFFSVERILG